MSVIAWKMKLGSIWNQRIEFTLALRFITLMKSVLVDSQASGGRPFIERQIAGERQHGFTAAPRLRGFYYSSFFVYFPFSGEGWAEKIHPMVVEKPTKLIK
jgi:hypothetical protein